MGAFDLIQLLTQHRTATYVAFSGTSQGLGSLLHFEVSCLLLDSCSNSQKPPYLLGPVLLLDNARPLVQVCLLGTCGLIRTVLHIATGTHSYYYIPAEVFLFQAEHSWSYKLEFVNWRLWASSGPQMCFVWPVVVEKYWISCQHLKIIAFHWKVWSSSISWKLKRSGFIISVLDETYILQIVTLICRLWVQPLHFIALPPPLKSLFHVSLDLSLFLSFPICAAKCQVLSSFKNIIFMVMKIFNKNIIENLGNYRKIKPCLAFL